MSLADRVDMTKTRARPRRIGVAAWLRKNMAELDEMLARDRPPTWEAIAKVAREDGVDADGRLLGQTHSRIKRSGAKVRTKAKGSDLPRPVTPVVQPMATKAELLVSVVDPPRRKLGRVGQ